ncbi:MAG: urease accessory protein UreD [Porticoccaceae bacterium]|nr:urease accessory protein UreD [Porticoccaceae bacterium]
MPDYTQSTAQRTGWQAKLTLDYQLKGIKTCLAHKSQKGPLTVQRPFYPEGDICHSYILHPPGGVVGGDILDIQLNAADNAHCLITTPGATKFYRSKNDRESCQTLRINVEKNAVVEWLPQQNIFFTGARSQLNTEINIQPGGKFIGWEMHCFGRPANRERFDEGTIKSCTQINIDGELRLVEQLNTEGDSLARSSCGLRSKAMQASLIAAPFSEVQKQKLEQLLLNYPHKDLIGLTLVDEILVIRVLGDHIEPILENFISLWSQLRTDWLQRPACPPRIWDT